MTKVYQPLNPDVELLIDHRIVRTHVVAHRRLKKQLGPAAPTVEELIKREFTHKSARQLVEEYLADKSPRRSRGTIRLMQGGKTVLFD
jgi:hypothetical protein